MPTRVYGYKATGSDVLHVLNADADTSICRQVTDIEITETPWGRCSVYRLDNHVPDESLCKRCAYRAGIGQRTEHSDAAKRIMRRHWWETYRDAGQCVP